MSHSIETLLLPTDGSHGALTGARFGIGLARALDAEIHVLSVIDTTLERLPVSADTEGSTAGGSPTAQSSVEAVETIARETDATLPVTTAIEDGVPHETIVEYATDHAVDGIVMGTKGRTGLDRVLLGSVTERVLRTTPVPLLAVPLEAAGTTATEDICEDILLPTDGSEGAGVAVDWGIELAAEFDAMVHTLYSVDTTPLGLDSTPGETLSQLEAHGRETLETVRTDAREAGISVSGTVTSGPPTRVILSYIHHNSVDLVVMGTRGRSGLSQQVFGSVTENVVRHAAVPVFCVPLRDDS